MAKRVSASATKGELPVSSSSQLMMDSSCVCLVGVDVLQGVAEVLWVAILSPRTAVAGVRELIWCELSGDKGLVIVNVVELNCDSVKIECDRKILCVYTTRTDPLPHSYPHGQSSSSSIPMDTYCMHE